MLPSREYKLVIFGGGGVGKSALTIRFCHGAFAERYDPTIEDSYMKSMTVDHVQCQCEILDTAGTDQFPALHSLYMKSGDGFILVFALNSRDSIEDLLPIRDSIVRQKEDLDIKKENVPFLLIGNKCDLIMERKVGAEVGASLSRFWGGVAYYETSAKSGVNVAVVFKCIVRQIMALELDMNPQSRLKKRKARCIFT
ncbi:hypothetical protein BT69DRAFT_1314870 [Atractiella rhizophila]|nr:hypothetical protein BT69DRAFT_1314870 [Atractiella rhizophila]